MPIGAGPPPPREDMEAGPGAGAGSANRLRLSIVDVTFALFCLIPPLVFGAQLLNSDGDAARHIRMGQLILSGGLFQNDTFSFTRPDEPMLLTEWASRVVFAAVHGAGGLAAVCLFAGLVIGAAYALVVLFLRRRGVDPLLAYLIGICAAVVGQIHWLARPHVFTFLGLALLLFLLEPARRRRVWLHAPLFLVWANLHGGFVLGLIIIGAYAVGAAVEAWLDAGGRAHWVGLARYHAAGLALAFLATLVNPAGPLLHARVLSLLGSAELTGGTFEFMSPNFHTMDGRLFLVVLAATVAVLTVLRRPAFPRFATILLMIAGALVARRNIALYGLVVLPLLALHADAAWRSVRQPRWLVKVRSAFQDGEAIARPGRWLAVPLGVLLGLGVVRGSIGDAELVPDRFDAEIFPIGAVAAARDAGLQGNLFNHFTWGGYVVYAWPGQQIFIDGMTDYFGEDIFREYRRMVRLEPGWDEVVRKYDIELVLLPPEGPLAYALRTRTDWSVWYEDDTAVLLRRHPPS